MGLQMKKKPVHGFLCALLGVYIAAGSPAVSRPPSSGQDFLQLKSKGLYREALQAIGGADFRNEDARQCELALLRVTELAKYPDLAGDALAALDRLSDAEAMETVQLLKARLDQARWGILLKMGDIRSAGRIAGRYHYLDFAVAGPFECSGLDSFDSERGPESAADASSFTGRFGPVSWFGASPDRSGVIDMESLLPARPDDLFYFYREFDICDPGEYDILLGKCGYTDVLLDGKPVFSSRAGHEFMLDQFRIRVAMNAGTHRILVKTGYSRRGIRLSLRIADASGRPVEAQKPASGGGCAPSSVVEVAPYTLLAGGGSSDEDLFMKGYFFFIAGFVSDEEREAQYCFEAIGPDSVYYPSAQYCLGEAETDDQGALDRFRRSFNAGTGNAEAGIKLVRLKIELEQYDEAYEIVSAMEKLACPSFLCTQAMAEYCAARGWDIEAMKSTGPLKMSMPCEAAVIVAGIHERQGDFAAAAASMRIVAAADRYDRLSAEKYIELCGLSGKTGESRTALHEAVALHPYCMRFRLLLAENLGHGAGGESLACLASALNASPYNPEVLAALGREYLRLGNSALAGHYLRGALERDPENAALRLEVGLLARNGGDLARFMIHEDVMSLSERARPFGDEPAVVLLDESVTLLGAAGSEEVHVRRIVLINDDSAAEDYAVQHVVFSPETEKVENLTCTLWKSGSPAVISERYFKSLSDPESRLYYDLGAVIVPVPGISAGDILDIGYTVTMKCGEDGCAAFGKSYVLGGRRRIIEYNHVLAAPRSRKIRCHAVSGSSGLACKAPAPSADRDLLVYTIREKNLPPHRDEPGMPDRGDFLPSVVFTTFGSWDEVFDWYRSVISGRKIVSDEMREAVRKLTTGVSSPAEKAARIYRHVASEIRYVGFEFGIGGIRPRRTDQTYASRMGDCKDTALVLEAMLEEAGLQADLSLVRTYDNGAFDPGVPHLGFFNHALCCVYLDGPLFLDATADYTGLRDLPECDRGISALVIGEKGCRFVSTSDSGLNGNAVTIYNRIALEAGGSARIKRTLRKQGPSAVEIRSGMENPAKKARSLMQYWNRRFTGASIENLQIAGADMESPAECSYEITAPSVCEKTDADLIAPSFLVGSGLFDAYALISGRDSPLLLPETGRTEVESVFIVPGGYVVHRLPENESSGSGPFAASFTYEIREGAVVVRSVIDIGAKRIETGSYGAFRELAAFINRKEREKIILSKKNR